MRAPLVAPPSLLRQAEIPSGLAFHFGGRMLIVRRVFGCDKGAPVIVEEMADFGESTLRGQLSLWSVGGVTAAMRSAVEGEAAA